MGAERGVLGVHRRTTPGVVAGRVQRKNRRELTPDYAHGRFEGLRFDRRSPGRGYRHVVGRRDVDRFVRLLPEWDELSTGLEGIVLAPGEPRVEGWCTPGVVALCAWQADLETVEHRVHVEDHAEVLDVLGVRWEPLPRDRARVLWTEPTVRAYQLLHVLLHELGHHHDRMTTRSQRECSRGEGYAEAYATRHAARVLDDYLRVFGL